MPREIAKRGYCSPVRCVYVCKWRQWTIGLLQIQGRGPSHNRGFLCVQLLSVSTNKVMAAYFGIIATASASAHSHRIEMLNVLHVLHINNASGLHMLGDATHTHTRTAPCAFQNRSRKCTLVKPVSQLGRMLILCFGLFEWERSCVTSRSTG